MGMQEEEILKLRSDEYLEETLHLVSVGKYDLAISAIHLHCDLRIRSSILRRGVPYPKTHSLKELIKIVEKLDNKVSFLLSNPDNLLRKSRIEEGYISSRYFPIRFGKDDVAPLLKFVQDVYDRYID